MNRNRVLRRSLGVSLAWCIAALSVAAGSSTAPDPPIALGVEKTLDSDRLGHVRRVFVSLPSDYAKGEERYPVLYLLDGDRLFESTAAAARFLASAGAIPPLIVVGVANDVDRGYYLTPPFDRWLSRSGGADEFLGFLETELIPWVDSEYRTAPHRTLAGSSFGGIFVLHALYSKPDLFHAYLAASPSLHMGEGSLVDAAASRLDRGLPSSRFLFLSLADERNELVWGQEMRTHFDRLVELLNYRHRSAGLRFEARQYPDETHSTVKLRAFSDGLRSLFWQWPIPEFRSRRGLSGLEEHFRELSKELGFELGIPVVAFVDLGSRALDRDEADQAVELFRLATERFAESPILWHGLAESLEKVGEGDSALEAMARAVDTAQRSDDPDLERYRRRLQAMEQRLGVEP